jgi:ribokinase
LSAPRIAVVGSYATGLTMRVKRIPGAGETLLGSGYRVDFGGKGSNQAVGCARLGAHVDFVARIGNDAFGEMAIGLYRDEGIDTTWVTRCVEAPTGVGFIVVEEESGHNSIVLDPGANELLTAMDVAKAEAALASASVVLTQLEIPVEAAESALALGRKAGAITILNPAPVRPLPASVLGLVDILTPNEKEARILAGRAPDVSIDAEIVARELIQHGAKQIVMTLGERGALLVSDRSTKYFPSVSVEAVDTTGAGDAFNAGLATALAQGTSLAEAVQFAGITGGMAVTKHGVIPSLPRHHEALEFCRLHEMIAPQWLMHNAKNGLD